MIFGWWEETMQFVVRSIHDGSRDCKMAETFTGLMSYLLSQSCFQSSVHAEIIFFVSSLASCFLTQRRYYVTNVYFTTDSVSVVR